MQFGPVLAKSILVEADQALTQRNANPTTTRVNKEAKALFKRFEHVFLLEQRPVISSITVVAPKGQERRADC
jgi:hypothetical protein